MNIDKQQAMEKLAALEKETAELRRIIEAPEQKGLWKPEDGDVCWRVTSLDSGPVLRFIYDSESQSAAACVNRGYVFQTELAARKAAPLMARNNMMIAAGLMADPDAGEYSSERTRSVTRSEGKPWRGMNYTSNDCVDMPIYVHTNEQADEMARILNAEGVK